MNPFQKEVGRYLAARARFEALPADLELTDEPRFKRAENTFHRAWDRVLAVPPESWTDLADALEVYCDGGDSLPSDEAVGMLITAARRLRGGISDRLRVLSPRQGEPDHG